MPDTIKRDRKRPYKPFHVKQSGAVRSFPKETAHEHKKQLSVRDLREKMARQYCDLRQERAYRIPRVASRHGEGYAGAVS